MRGPRRSAMRPVSHEGGAGGASAAAGTSGYVRPEVVQAEVAGAREYLVIQSFSKSAFLTGRLK